MDFGKKGTAARDSGGYHGNYMRISLNDVWLTNDGTTDLQSWTDAHDVELNGKQIVQDAQFLRALAAQPLARGNQVNLLRFTVTRQHVSVAEAAAYVLTAFSSLPGSGTATILCGASGETLLTCTLSAVLEETLGTDPFTEGLLARTPTQVLDFYRRTPA